MQMYKVMMLPLAEEDIVKYKRDSGRYISGIF